MAEEIVFEEVYEINIRRFSLPKEAFPGGFIGSLCFSAILDDDYLPSTFSMRESGISQMTATTTYSAMEIAGLMKVEMTAAA